MRCCREARSAAVRQDTVARDDVEFTHLRQLGNESLGEAAREELKRVTATLGLEVEDRDAPGIVPCCHHGNRLPAPSGQELTPAIPATARTATTAPTMSQVRFGLGSSTASNSAAGVCPVPPGRMTLAVVRLVEMGTC